MSRLSFVSVFKLLKEEFGTHSKDDWEAVLESLNEEKEIEEETRDHVPQPHFKHKYTDTESENDECDQFDELKQSLPNMYHSRISNISTQIQRVKMMNVISLMNLNKAFLIQKNWFLIHLRVRK